MRFRRTKASFVVLCGAALLVGAGSALAVTKTGTSGRDIIRGSGEEDVLRGLAGNDDLYGLDDDDVLRGGAGRDRLYGGEDDDILYGDDGNDTLVGGKDENRYYGGRGDDTVKARNDEEERINCGAGVDTVTADSEDVIAADCENVSRA
jgi:Ca2+-binding RTX toxin-like protein